MSRCNRVSLGLLILGAGLIPLTLIVDALRNDGPGLVPFLARMVYLGILFLAGGAFLLPGSALRTWLKQRETRAWSLACLTGEATLWILLFYGTRKWIHAWSHPYRSIWGWLLLSATASLGLALWYSRSQVGTLALRLPQFFGSLVPLDPAAQKRGRRVLIGLTVFLTIALCWFPLRQLIQTNGLLCYQNAFDEYSYLQYDFSKATLSPTRSGQALVYLGHRLGLSGGWINLSMDMGCTVGLFLAASWLFCKLGFSLRQSSVAGMALLLLPILFGGFNPWMNWWFERVVHSRFLYWIAAPQAWYLPISRSPEPQFSLVLATANIAAALHWRRFWVAYLCIPFLYPFILVPYLFTLVSLHACQYWRLNGWKVLWALLGAYSLACLGAWVQVAILSPPRLREMMVASHLPVVSTTGIISVLLFILLRQFTQTHLRQASLVIALAPTFANNLHVLSGYFSAPHNFEQYAGVVSCSLVLILAIVPWLQYRILETGAVLGLVWLGLAHAQDCYRNQQTITAHLQLTPELLSALREDPTGVVVEDSSVASLLSLLYPQQPTTPLALQNSYPILAERSFPRYVQVRATLLRDPTLAASYEKSLAELDRFYRYESEDFILWHNRRKTQFHLRHSVEETVPPDTPLRLHIFLDGKPVSRVVVVRSE